MLPKLKDVIDLLNQFAPFSLAEPWDNSGLQVGSAFQEVGKIYISLDPTARALDLAIKCGANLLLTHHPLIFPTLSNINVDSYPGNVINTAIKNEISIVSVHTNLDVVEHGISYFLATMLGIHDLKVLKESDGTDGIGFGRIGEINPSETLTNFTERVKSTLGVENPRIVGDSQQQVKRVAVIGGSGGSFIPIAADMEADLLVTGDINHHQALQAESLGLAVIDGDHYYTEKNPFNAFANEFLKIAEAKDWEIKIIVDEGEKSPIKGFFH